MQYLSARFGFALVVLLAFCSRLAGADGLLVSSGKTIRLLDSSDFQMVRSAQAEGGQVLAMALHPATSVLATVSVDGSLSFWNLPSLKLASQSKDALFQAVTDLEFSADGASLYLLSEELGAVVVFDLSSSKVSGFLPVPGGEALTLDLFGENLLVHQVHGAVVLSKVQEMGMLAQVKFPEIVVSASTAGDKLYLARKGALGVDVYQASGAQFLGLVAVGSRPRVVRFFGAQNKTLLILTETGALQRWDLAKEAVSWTFASTGQSYDWLLLGSGGRLAFLLEAKSGVVVGVSTDSGTEVVSGRLAEGVNQAIFYPGAL